MAFVPFPLPEPFSEGVAEVGQKFNALRRGKIENTIREATAKYAPYQAYGNAFLTNQQAQWLPYQYQMQALSNPLLWMAAEKNPALQEQLRLMMSNPLQSSSSAPNIPMPEQKSSTIFNAMLKNLGLNTEEQPTAQQNNLPLNPLPMMQGIQQYPNVPTNIPIQPSQNNAMPNPVSSPSIGYNTPSNVAAGQIAGQGGLGAENPLSAANAQQKGMEATLTGQATTQTAQQSARSKMLSNQSQIATNALKSLEAYSRNYDKSSYKGQYIGERAEKTPTLPGGTIAPEQLANRYANQFLTDLSGLGDTPAGRTDEGRSLIAAGKPDLSLDPDAKKELVESFTSKLNRMIKLRDFANDFYTRNPGATDEQLVGLMNAYNRYAPSYDYKNGKPLPENDKKFRDFTSPEALNSYKINGDYNPYQNNKTSTKKIPYAKTPEEFMNGKAAEKTKIINKQRIVFIGGKWYYAD